MAELNPAAQAVLDSVLKLPDGPELEEILAAALRAVADQVVPEPPMLAPGGRSYEAAWTATVQDAIRRDILAITAEMESAQASKSTHLEVGDE